MSTQAPVVDGISGVRRALGPLSGLLSLRYLVLRSFTAMAAVANGLVQTFIFARVLSPRDFSIFILIGSLALTLWMLELGAAKILFVQQRQRHLKRQADDAIAVQSNALILLYAFIVLCGSGLCFAVMASRPSVTPLQAAQFAAFFGFIALNLVWFPLRNVSIAVDDFIIFETLEAIRRVGHLALMLAMLIGLSLSAFLVLANLLWVVLFAACIWRLLGKRALACRLRGCFDALATFWRRHRAELLRTGNYAVGELAIYYFPYLVVPMAFGLGAPTIILDTVFKVFRGATLIYAAGLDPLVPQQTRAFAENDVATLKKATWAAAMLCAVPTIALCAVVLLAGDRVFALLLGHAATIPHMAMAILVVLLLANLAQNVASNLLLHTGFFRELARVASMMVAAMALMSAIVIACGADVLGFLAGYAVVYVVGATLYISYVIKRVLVERGGKAMPGLPRS